jgi:hypothetical protein
MGNDNFRNVSFYFKYSAEEIKEDQESSEDSEEEE